MYFSLLKLILLVVLMDIMMFCNLNVYNVLINVQPAYCLILIVLHVKEILGQ